MRLSVRHPPDVLFVGPFSLYKYRYVAFSPSPRKMANTDLLVDRQTDRQTQRCHCFTHHANAPYVGRSVLFSIVNSKRW